MTPKTFWQELDKTLNRIGLFQNSGTLIFNLIKTDKTGGKTQTLSFEREIPCPAPEKVTAHMIDGNRVCGGDMQTNIDYLTLKEIYTGLAENFNWNESTGMIREGIDMFRFGGVNYRIRSIRPEDWQNNMPGSYTLILEMVSKARQG